MLDSCEKYSDTKWLARIRRWPPVMVRIECLPNLCSKAATCYLKARVLYLHQLSYDVAVNRAEVVQGQIQQEASVVSQLLEGGCTCP